MTDNYELVGSIRRDLQRIADNYDEALDPVRRAAGSPVKGSKEPPLPVSAHILDVRADAHRDLMFWARFLLDEVRDVNGAAITYRHGTDEVASLVAFVTVWVEWLVTNMPDDADNLATEAAQHARALRAVVEEIGARRFPIGACIEHGTSDMGERIPCPGQMRAVLRKTDDLLPSEITCSLDAEHAWPASEWLRLGRRIIEGQTA
jgi:hypothetical protein